MKASCIGAAGMTSGFGPSDQECLWLCRKLIFLRRIIILCHALTHSKVIHAFASPAEREKKIKKKKIGKIQKKNYALKRISVDERSKRKRTSVNPREFRVFSSQSVWLFSFLFSITGFRCKRCNRLDAPPLRSVTA